jgi:hypothetical protein
MDLTFVNFLLTEREKSRAGFALCGTITLLQGHFRQYSHISGGFCPFRNGDTTHPYLIPNALEYLASDFRQVLLPNFFPEVQMRAQRPDNLVSSEYTCRDAGGKTTTRAQLT